MAQPRTLLSLQQLETALVRLEEALNEPPDAPLLLDGTVQRFEFVFELSWKTLMHVLSEDGIDVNTPRQSLRSAASAGLITDERSWLELLEARNLTSHTYNEEIARRVFATIKRRHGQLAALPAVIRKHLAQL
jgi:nucleotidyltransferase substrate binding protein (TIGR01987 family)